MEITIKKTKLTKSIVNQMLFIAIENLKDAEILGMLVNVRKNYPKVMLLKKGNDYFLFDMRWKKGETSFYFTTDKGTRYKKFKSKEECDYYWNIFEKARNIAEENHIYI